MSDKILLIEDDIQTGDGIYHKLEQLNYDVLAKANNSADAVRFAKDLRPDLVLLDIKQGDYNDGIDAASQILSFLDIPVVYITERSDDETIKRLMKVEPNAFIIKPFDEKILRSAIDIAIYRHQVKKELLEVKEMLSTTIESIDDIVIAFDSKGFLRYIHKNSQENIPFIISQNPLNKHYSKVFKPVMVRKLDTGIDNLMKTNKVQEFDIELGEHQDIRWYRAKVSIRRGLDNSTIGITLIVSDITRQKLMEKELIVSREKLTEAQNIARLGTCEIDFSKKILFHNGVFFDLLGIESPDNVKMIDDEKILNAIHPGDRKRFLDYYKEVFEKRSEKLSVDFRINKNNSDICYMHSIGKAVYDAAGNAVAILITIQDVSWQKQSQKLWHDLFNARKSAEIKQQFFSNVSHQLRTPLTEIIGVIELISQTELYTKQRDYISTLRDSSETLINMINDILDTSKIEAGKMKLNPSIYDLRYNVNKIINLFNKVAFDKMIKLNWSVDDKLPPLLFVDGGRVNQVIFNLLSNALKFTGEKGSVSMIISADFQEKDDLIIRVEVKDNGIGISKEDHEALFSAFQKSHQGSQKNTIGPGLGLYICKNLVDLLDGDIDMESEPGEGSTFWFTFKAKVCKNVAGSEKSYVSEAKVPRELNMSVLLVEDKEENQKVLALMLESIGCEVTVASNGEEAVKLYQETAINAFGIFGKVDYDLIIMDMHMPVMDGVAAAGQLREKFDNLPPIICLSASVLDDSSNGYEKLGFDDYLEKPVNMDLLSKKLHYWKNNTKKGYKKPGIISYESFIVDIEKNPVINENTISNIVKYAGDNYLNIKTLMDSFIYDMDNYYHKSINAFENNDRETILQTITAIKGLSATIGASRVHEITKRMEYFAEEGNYEQVKNLFSILGNEYKEFKSYVEDNYYVN